MAEGLLQALEKLKSLGIAPPTQEQLLAKRIANDPYKDYVYDPTTEIFRKDWYTYGPSRNIGYDVNSSIGLFNRPQEIPEGLYLPQRPSVINDRDTGEANRIKSAVESWYNYYDKNPELKQYLSQDEIAELNYLDYRTGKISKGDFQKNVEQQYSSTPIGKAFDLGPGKVVWQGGLKKTSSDPFYDVARYGGSIGGYTNPENMKSDTKEFLSSPAFGMLTAFATAGLAPEVAALVNAGTTAGSNYYLTGDLGDALKAGLTSYASSGAAQGLLGGSVGLPGAASGVTYGDILGTAYKASQGDWGGVLSNIGGAIDFGQLGESGLTDFLPESLKEALRKVEISDILSGDYMAILNDVNNPFKGTTPEWLANLSDAFKVNYSTPEWIKNAVGAVDESLKWLPNGGNISNPFNGFGSIFPNGGDINNPFNGLDINIPSISLPSFGSGMLSGQQAPSDPYQKFYWDIGYENPITV